MYDEEIEKVVLFGIIFENYDFEIHEEDFVNSRNKKIAKAIIELKNNKEEISILTIQSKIKANKSQVLEYISTIGDLYVTGMDIQSIYNQFIVLSQKRKIFNLLKNGLKEIQDEDPELFAQRIIKKLEAIEQREEIEKTFAEKIIDATQELEKKYNNQDDYSLYTGLSHLDDMTCGLHNQEFTIIGARPGVGKTTIALQFAQNIASKTKDVLFISLEMSDEQLIQKMIARSGNIQGYRMRRGTLEDTDWQKVVIASSQLSKLKFNITTKIRNVQQLEVLARKLKNQNKLGLLIIDYIQLLRNADKFPSREQEVADISRRLKLLSLELDIPIIALCQLNRNASRNEPTLADLRESGSLEQDADNIIFLYKENEDDDIVTLKLAKQRAGEIGKIKLKFMKNISEFKELN